MKKMEEERQTSLNAERLVFGYKYKGVAGINQLLNNVTANVLKKDSVKKVKDIGDLASTLKKEKDVGIVNKLMQGAEENIFIEDDLIIDEVIEPPPAVKQQLTAQRLAIKKEIGESASSSMLTNMTTNWGGPGSSSLMNQSSSVLETTG